MRRILLILFVFSLLTAVPAQTDVGSAAAPALAEPAPYCGYSLQNAALAAQTSRDSWSGWIARLSGEAPVQISGQSRYIVTRHSEALFNGATPAFDYLHQTLLQWYPESRIREDPYLAWVDSQTSPVVWKNLELTIPGHTRPDEIVLLTAHFDSTVFQWIGNPSSHAPGADDNATGSAALLEAARVLQNRAFTRTLKLVWFTGEEQGLLGSRAYTSQNDLTGVVGVINLDMFSYDSDNDRLYPARRPPSCPG
jgi:hypothetical protein